VETCFNSYPASTVTSKRYGCERSRWVRETAEPSNRQSFAVLPEDFRESTENGRGFFYTSRRFRL
jgi:hypothetical protein